MTKEPFGRRLYRYFWLASIINGVVFVIFIRSFIYIDNPFVFIIGVNFITAFIAATMNHYQSNDKLKNKEK